MALAGDVDGGAVVVTSRRQSRQRADDELAYVLRRRRMLRRRSLGVPATPVEDLPASAASPVAPVGPVGPAGPVGAEFEGVLCMPTTEGVIIHAMQGSWMCRSGVWVQLIYGNQ